MNDPVEQIKNIANMDDFLNFVIQLAEDAKEHPEEWANTTITAYLVKLASWIDKWHVNHLRFCIYLNCVREPKSFYTDAVNILKYFTHRICFQFEAPEKFV